MTLVLLLMHTDSSSARRVLLFLHFPAVLCTLLNLPPVWCLLFWPHKR